MVNKSEKWLKGPYRPKNPSKYKGDLRNIVFRSSWELKMFKYCDYSDNVLEWSSESIIVPYKNPMTGSYHRYFIDLYMKHRTKSGEIKKKMIEIKPAKQLKPPKVPKRKTKAYLKEVETYIINKSKWASADKYAKKHGMDFVILTENDIGIY